MSMAPTRGKGVLRSEPCLALIGDMVGSRELLPSRRPKIQERFREFIQYLNKKYAKDILAKFVITLGDEFQGLLLSATPVPDLMWDIDQRFTDRDLRVGVGFGVLTTPIQEEAINVDGPALYNARAAIENARRKRSLGGVFFGFGEADQVMNGIAHLDRKSTRLNSSHGYISYAVFCLKKTKTKNTQQRRQMRNKSIARCKL